MRRITRMACAGLLLLAISCQPDQEDTAPMPVTPVEKVTKNFVQEEAYPGVKGTPESIIVNGENVSALHMDGNYVLEGDILISDKVVGTNASGNPEAVGVVGRRWPNGVVYYDVADDMPKINRINISQAIRHWDENTNLRFEWRTNQPNYVVFEPGEGCASEEGMVRGRQVIKLSPECDYGNTLHEIGHCVGLFHEHNRLNRDRYVEIIFENIEEGKEHNFIRTDILDSDVKDWAGQFNFGSIMMYHPTAFSINGKPTIVRRDGKGYAAQRERLTSVDIMGVNYMYKDE